MAGYTDEVKAMIARQAKMPSATQEVKTLNTQVNGITQPTVKPVAAPDNYGTEQTSRIEDMYNKLRASQMVQAGAQREQSVNNLRRQLAEKLPQYQTQRAQADVGQQQNFNKLKEYMAGQGAFNSGDNLSRASNILVQRQNAVNQINGDQNAYEVGINNNIADADAQYMTALNSINSQLDAQKAQAIMSLQNQLRQENYQKSRDAVGDERFNQQFNYQVGRDNVADNRFNTQFDYQKAQDLQNYNYQLGRDNVLDNRWNTEFDYTKNRDTVKDNQWQSQFDYTKQSDVDNRNFQASQNALKASSSSSADMKAQKEADTNAVWNELFKNIDSRNGEAFLQANREAIVENLGASEYQKLLKYVKDYAYSATENKQYSQRLNNRTPADYIPY